MISFIIPTYKNTHSLKNCLEYIQKAVDFNRFYDYEILLIDNNPEKGLINKWQFPGINNLEIYHNPIPGAHASRKMAVEMAKGTMFLFVDDDNYLLPEYVEYILKRYAEINEPYFIGCANLTYEPIDWDALGLPSHSYACGSLEGQKFKQNIPIYWGAGVAIHASLARKMYQYPLIVDGRSFGKKIIYSGEDHEMALRAYFYKSTPAYFNKTGLLHHLNTARLNHEYHNKLMSGFELAAWNLRIYYWFNQHSIFIKSPFLYFTGNLGYSIVYFLLHPLKISARRILSEALNIKKTVKRYQLVKKVLQAE